jgi:hypothetical protein
MEDCIKRVFKENNVLNKFSLGFALAPLPISQYSYHSFLSLSLLSRPMMVEALAMLLDGRVGLVRLS